MDAYNLWMQLSLHHVSINVSDAERAVAFYRDVLGMAELPRPNFNFGGAWLDAGDSRQVHLIETNSVPEDVGQHMAFAVVDIEAAIDAIRGKGVEVTDSKSVADTTLRQAFFHDPDGNRLEINQL